MANIDGEHFILGAVNWTRQLAAYIVTFNIFRLFLWRYVKAHDYTDKPASIATLEGNIKAFIREIRAAMLERICQNWTK